LGWRISRNQRLSLLGPPLSPSRSLAKVARGKRQKMSASPVPPQRSLKPANSDMMLQPKIQPEHFLPPELPPIEDSQRTLPKIAKDPKLMAAIDEAVQSVPTEHHLFRGDARKMLLASESIHLVLTSPPYWTLKEYRDTEGQIGHLADYEVFLSELDRVWNLCYNALVPGGRLICVVGDVCLSRRKNNGRHSVVPLHASIQERCRKIGFDNLSPIIWHKIANAVYEVEGGSSFLGKPYEPNSVIKNDIEFILMQRKPGGYRKPSIETRILSLISETKHRQWFQQIM